MKKYINSIWQLLSNIGIDPQLNAKNQIEIRVSNRLAIVLFFLLSLIFLCIAIFSEVLQVKLLTLSDLRILLSAFICLVVLFWNHKGQILIGKLTLSVVPLLVILFFPVFIDGISDDLIFISSIIIITYSAIPHFIFNFIYERNYYLFSILLMLLLLFSFEYIYITLEPDLQSWQYKKPWFFYIKMAETLTFLYLNIILFFINYQNNKLKHQMLDSLQESATKNTTIEAQKAAITKYTDQLNNYQDELMTNQEELMQQAEELNSQKLELHKLYSELHNTYHQLVRSEKLATLGQLTSGIVSIIDSPIVSTKKHLHGLQTNIENVTKVFKEYLKIDPKDIKDRKSSIEQIKHKIRFYDSINQIKDIPKTVAQNINEAIHLIMELKSFARLSIPDKVQVDIHSGLNSTLFLLNHQIKPDTTVIKEFSSIPLIYCYPGKMNQVFLNILTNAIASLNETHIKEKYIKISTSKVVEGSEEFVSIQIENNGKMITEELKSKIFEPFFTTKEAPKGAGLGLSIALNIVEDHEGKINVFSEKESTVFEVLLPVKIKLSSGKENV